MTRTTSSRSSTRSSRSKRRLPSKPLKSLKYSSKQRKNLLVPPHPKCPASSPASNRRRFRTFLAKTSSNSANKITTRSSIESLTRSVRTRPLRTASFSPGSIPSPPLWLAPRIRIWREWLRRARRFTISRRLMRRRSGWLTRWMPWLSCSRRTRNCENATRKWKESWIIRTRRTLSLILRISS